MDSKIDIKSFVNKVSSRWYYFLISLAVVLAVAFVYTELVPPAYRIRASILLDSEGGHSNKPEKFMKGMELLQSETEIEDEIGMIRSLNLVENTLHRLDFGISYFTKRNFRTREQYNKEDFPFVIELDSTVNQLVGVPVYIERTSANTYSVKASGEDVRTYNFSTDRAGESLSQIDINSVSFNDKPFEHKNLRFTIKFKEPFRSGSGNASYFFVIHNLGSLAASYREKLDIKPIARESNIVEVNLEGEVPVKETLFLNTLLNVYLTEELNKRQQLGLRTIDFIDEQLKGVSTELNEAEGSLESFRARNNILNLSATAENLVTNIDKLEEDQLKLQTKLKYYKYIANSLGKGDDVKNIVTPSTYGLEDPLLNSLLLELTKLNQERSGLNQSMSEENPVAETINLKIANTKRALVENVNNFIEATTATLDDLDSKIGELKGRVSTLPRSERELVNIQRRFDFNDNVYNYLLEKRAEAGIAVASNSVEKSVVDRARQVGDGPVFPNRLVIFLIAGVIGLSLAGGVMLVKDAFNDSIVTTADVEKSTQIPFIGAIAHGSRRDRASTVVAHTNSELGESFRSLRVNLQYLTLGHDDNVIGVTSSILGEGKTFCSVNLAAAVAMSGRKTVLIDADLRRPSVAASFRLKNERGLSNYLNGTCSLREIIKGTPIEGLDVITAGNMPHNPLELIGLPKMEELIRTLKGVYNTIVIDSPPLGYVAEYIILMKYTNANIYVVRSNFTNRNQLEKINRLYNDKKIKNVRILLNDAKTSLNGYYYSYGHAY